MSRPLLQTKRKASEILELLDIPNTPSPTQKSPGSEMDDLIDQLFRDGIAHEEQWTFPARHLTHQEDREKVLQTLKARFSPNVSLIYQLPTKDPDAIRSAFYNVTENWFFQAFEASGYDGGLCSRTLFRWLNGDINTLVLCGDGLSLAKTLFNHIVSCFPLAYIDTAINSFPTMSRISNHASVYCLPFVEEKPKAVMLHLMEGNSAACVMDRDPIYIRKMPMLIHCMNNHIAHSFIAKNTVLFFLSDHYSRIGSCYLPREELRDFVFNSPTPDACYMNVHCRRGNGVCTVCIERDVSE